MSDEEIHIIGILGFAVLGLIAIGFAVLADGPPVCNASHVAVRQSRGGPWVCVQGYLP